MRSSIWKLNQIRMQRLPESIEGLLSVQRTELFAVQTANVDEQRRSAIAWESILDRRHPGWRKRIGDLSESSMTPREHCFIHNNRRVSLDFYKKLNLALEVLRSKPESVIEIGAGWGQVGRILWHLAKVKYTVIDLPETLRWPRVFLHAENVPATFLTDADYQNAGKADCLLNSSSFGEMPRDTAAGYLRYFNSSRVRRTVLLNRLLNTYDPWLEAQREHECGWYFYADPTAAVERWELEPDFTTIPGVELHGHHRELFLILREGTPTLDSIDEIASQSWTAHRSNRASSRTTHILTPDMRVLQTLLEHARVRPTARSLELLLQYLESISLRHPFEETRFLRDLQRQLVGSTDTYEPLVAKLQRATSLIIRCLFYLRYA